MWNHVNPHDWLNKFYNIYMAVQSVSLVGVALELNHVVEINLIRVSYHFISYSFHLNSDLKQLYISNKTEHFSYKSGYGMTCIEAFKRRAGLGYRQTAYLKKLAIPLRNLRIKSF